MDQPTIDTYNRLAKDYDQETTPFWELFPRTVFDKFVAMAGKKVLDVGSGPGRDGLIMEDYGLDVTCLDASETMIEMCKQRGLKSVLGDFNQLPFDDASFDSVWAYTSLLHVKKADIDKPMAEIVRVLKPKGTLGLGMIEGKWEGYRESSGVNQPRWFSFYTAAEIRKLLKAHGLIELNFEVFKPGSRNYLNFIIQKVS